MGGRALHKLSALAGAVPWLRSQSSRERPICSVCKRISKLSRVLSTQSLSACNRSTPAGVACSGQALKAWATTARSPRACDRCSWSASQSAALASSCTQPCSMADSSPSEYENPPIGKAGEASQISCSRLLMSVGMRAVVVRMPMPMIVIVIVITARAVHMRFRMGVGVRVCVCMCVRMSTMA